MSTGITREYRTFDKSQWEYGPWRDEPDKVQWTDHATGLPCLAVRNHRGQWCGYVGVLPSHPWFGKEHSDSVGACGDTCDVIGSDPDTHYHYGCTPQGMVDVHGGMTFSGPCQGGDEAVGICHVPEPGEPDHVWWFGFDCAHSNDGVPSGAETVPLFRHGGVYRTLDYVRMQVTLLASQVAQYSVAGLLTNGGAL